VISSPTVCTYPDPKTCGGLRISSVSGLGKHGLMKAVLLKPAEPPTLDGCLRISGVFGP